MNSIHNDIEKTKDSIRKLGKKLAKASTKKDEKTINGVNSAQTVITLLPHCFTVDFNQDLVKISALN